MEENMLSDALKSIFGPLKNILDQCAGEKHELWKEILRLMSRMSPEKIHKALTEAESKLWERKVTVGGYTKEEIFNFFKRITYKVGNEERSGIYVSSLVHTLVDDHEHLFRAEIRGGVEFVKGSLRDLFGFRAVKSQGTFLNERFLARHGLVFCEPIDAFYLRINYTDQSLDEWVRVGMRPLSTSHSAILSLDLGHDSSNGIGLHADSGSSQNAWGPDGIWVFRRMTKIGA